VEYWSNFKLKYRKLGEQQTAIKSFIFQDKSSHFQNLETHLSDRQIMNAYYENPQDQKRISILVTKEIHRSIKMNALNSDQSMKDYIINLIMNHVNKQALNE
jgi:predicted HicB family RNase H-like nuclease